MAGRLLFVFLTYIVERESSMTPTMPTFSMTKGQTVDMPSSTGSSTSTYLTPVKQAPDIVERESSMTPTMPTFSMTKGQTVDMPSSTGSSTSTYLTPVKQAPETWILKFVAVVTGCGVIVGVILLFSAILYKKKTASVPPKLTVNPPVINETDSVTLNCQTPSSKTSTSVLLIQQSNSDNCRTKVNVSGLQAGYDETYSIVTYGSKT
ncbi:uncharacterized protein LOC144516895 [Sander vitreus]